MPPRLLLQILHHNPTHHHQLGLHIIQHLPITQVQPIRDLLTQPLKISMRRKQRVIQTRIMLVHLHKPLPPALVVCIIALPPLTRTAVVTILLALDLADGHDCLDGPAYADDGDGFDEAFAETADEGLAVRGRAVGGLAGQVEVELVGELGVAAAGESGEGDEVPAGGPEGGVGEGGFEVLEKLLDGGVELADGAVGVGHGWWRGFYVSVCGGWVMNGVGR